MRVGLSGGWEKEGCVRVCACVIIMCYYYVGVECGDLSASGRLLRRQQNQSQVFLVYFLVPLYIVEMVAYELLFTVEKMYNTVIDRELLPPWLTLIFISVSSLSGHTTHRSQRCAIDTVCVSNKQDVLCASFKL